jgi:uncharacterized membrane protein
MIDWYYAENDEIKGPINEAELKEKFVAKKLFPESLVWTEGMGDWVPAKTRPEFRFHEPPKPAAPKASPTPAPTAPPPSPAPASPQAAAPSPAPEENEPIEDEADELAAFDHLVHRVTAMEVDPEDFQKNKLMAIIGYIYCLCFLTLLVARKSPYARYHANQGLTLLIFGTLWWIVIAILATLIDFATSGKVIYYLVAGFFIVPLMFMALGISNAWKGVARPLPVIGRITLLQ